MAAFTVIDHTEIGSGGAASWSETGIASSYDHLLLKYSVRREASGVDDSYHLTLNSDTGSNYSATTLRVISSAANSYRNSGQANFNLANWAGAGATANTFGVGEIWIPHYANTANYKQMLVSNVVENASTTNFRMSVNAVLWSSTAAVTSITMLDDSGDIAEYSTFTLYGVTGA
jgi:hypothetical protein